MRESPLPDWAGGAGLVDGRVVVAIAKCMALCGLRPDQGDPCHGWAFTTLRVGDRPFFQATEFPRAARFAESASRFFAGSGAG
jgi:hypothetical protein